MFIKFLSFYALSPINIASFYDYISDLSANENKKEFDNFEKIHNKSDWAVNLEEKSYKQAKNAYELFSKFFSGEYLDQENFKIKLADLIVENSKEELRLYLIDSKKVEFSRYKNIPHLEKIVITQNETIEVLKSLVEEMERKYTLFEKAGVNELKKYNKKVEKKLPRIVVIFDEFADWMMDKEFKKEVENAIKSLTEKARAAGIHLIVSTQRPDNSVVVPILRANLGAKFAIRVDSEKNSKIILDEEGAEKLLGYGHMIVKFAGEKHYVQGAFIDDDEIDEILKGLK